jgi:hypothetical protein
MTFYLPIKTLLDNIQILLHWLHSSAHWVVTSFQHTSIGAIPHDEGFVSEGLSTTCLCQNSRSIWPLYHLPWKNKWLPVLRSNQCLSTVDSMCMSLCPLGTAKFWTLIYCGRFTRTNTWYNFGLYVLRKAHAFLHLFPEWGEIST